MLSILNSEVKCEENCVTTSNSVELNDFRERIVDVQDSKLKA